MEGVTIIKDETHNKRYVQIDMELLEDNESVEDLIDVLIIHMRKDEETYTLEEVEEALRKSGKL
ncbi:MAG: hypothetical protein H7X71_08180 [Chitinophagales bacterium]|nr:hypothetical protein [Chitinophagales bacterium]